MRIKFAVLLSGILLLSTQSVSAVNIEMVTVGNPGNAPDMRYNLDQRPEGYGAVNYVYQIGKYEITLGQYCEFLNAVAKPDDLHDLYNVYNFNPIVRTGFGRDISYSVAADWADRPAYFVSFWSAARFANWLHNGQPTGPQGPGTTEDGAYHDIGNDTLFGRNADAKFFIPTEDEWYKAAYHDTNAGRAATYFDYPTGTDAVPGTDITEATNSGNNANYGFAIGSPYYRTAVGEFELSDSPYGTFDQGGNVWEWAEVKVTSWSRGLRGGACSNRSYTLHASNRNKDFPTLVSDIVGFRMAAPAPVPEPTGVALFSIAAAMLGSSRLRMRRGKSA